MSDKHLSIKCSHSKVKVKCEWCGKVLERHPYRIKRTPHQFCCPDHRARWMSTIKGEKHFLSKRETRICLNCGNKFTVRPSEEKKYCSLTCYHAHKRGYVKRCIVCNSILKDNRRIYCSRECMGIDRQKRIKKLCPICGKEFFIRPCEDKDERNTCSKKCANKYKKGFYRITDSQMEEYLIDLHKKLGRIPNLIDLQYETENKNGLHWSLFVRRGGIRFWQKKLFGKSTYKFKWEQKCIELFNEVLGYPEFKTQKTFPWLKHYSDGMKRVGSLRIDLFYPQHNLCIEFDGEGHFKQINWERGKPETLALIKKRDELKNKLIIGHGLKLLRFRFDEPLTIEHIRERLSQFVNLV